jgi:tetratricopeptide (TPR) repeat protein
MHKQILVLAGFLIGLVSLPAQETIAVMPFENVSKSAKYGWIGAGCAESIITKLGKVKGISVLERNQLSRLTKEQELQMSGMVDEGKSIRIGKLLGAQSMIVGSYQIMEKAIKIQVRLLDVETGKVKASAEAKGQVDNLFSLQDELVFSLAARLGFVLDEEDKSKMANTRTVTAFEYYGKGEEASNKEDYRSAVEWYGKAITQDAAYADAWFGRGDAYYSLEEYEKAISDLNQALELDPEYDAAYTSRGYAKKDSGDPEAGIADFSAALERNKGDVWALIGRGEAYTDREQNNEALKDFNRALELAPDNNWAFAGRGFVRIAMEDYEKAASDFSTAIRIYGDDPWSYYGRGLTWAALANHDKAINDYDAAIRKDGKQGEFYYQRALSLREKNRKKEAKKDMQTALSLGQEEAQEMLDAWK